MKQFKAGKYYVGDPCYVFTDKEWDELIEQTYCFGIQYDKMPEGYEDTNVYNYKGMDFFTDGTAYGDGSYYDNEGRVYGVDAGLIGIVPFEILSTDGDGGQIIEFEKDFRVYSSGDGIFYFGNITIDTKNDDEDEDDDWEDDEEDN
jgi:hypothetical protein